MDRKERRREREGSFRRVPVHCPPSLLPLPPSTLTATLLPLFQELSAWYHVTLPARSSSGQSQNLHRFPFRSGVEISACSLVFSSLWFPQKVFTWRSNIVYSITRHLHSHPSSCVFLDSPKSDELASSFLPPTHHHPFFLPLLPNQHHQADMSDYKVASEFLCALMRRRRTKADILRRDSNSFLCRHHSRQPCRRITQPRSWEGHLLLL